jgi:hypothetical protein
MGGGRFCVMLPVFYRVSLRLVANALHLCHPRLILSSPRQAHEFHQEASPEHVGTTNLAQLILPVVEGRPLTLQQIFQGMSCVRHDKQFRFARVTQSLDDSACCCYQPRGCLPVHSSS